LRLGNFPFAEDSRRDRDELLLELLAAGPLHFLDTVGTTRTDQTPGQSAFSRAAVARLNRDGRLFDPIRAHISAPFVQDQFRRPTVTVGHKGNLRVKGLKKIIANALRKYLILVAVYLREQMIAVPDNADHERTHVVTS
jgi:hypothetical protein